LTVWHRGSPVYTLRHFFQQLFLGSCFVFLAVLWSFFFEIHKCAIIDHQKKFLPACLLLFTGLHLPFTLYYVIYVKKVVPYSIHVGAEPGL